LCRPFGFFAGPGLGPGGPPPRGRPWIMGKKDARGGRARAGTRGGGAGQGGRPPEGIREGGANWSNDAGRPDRGRGGAGVLPPSRRGFSCFSPVDSNKTTGGARARGGGGGEPAGPFVLGLRAPRLGFFGPAGKGGAGGGGDGGGRKGGARRRGGFFHPAGYFGQSGGGGGAEVSRFFLEGPGPRRKGFFFSKTRDGGRRLSVGGGALGGAGPRVWGGRGPIFRTGGGGGGETILGKKRREDHAPGGRGGRGAGLGGGKKPPSLHGGGGGACCSRGGGSPGRAFYYFFFPFFFPSFSGSLFGL